MCDRDEASMNQFASRSCGRNAMAAPLRPQRGNCFVDAPACGAARTTVILDSGLADGIDDLRWKSLGTSAKPSSCNLMSARRIRQRVLYD